MQIFILAISTFCSLAALVVTIVTYLKISAELKPSVPDQKSFVQNSQNVAKTEADPDKWKSLKEAFMSGKNNGRSRIS